MKNVENFIFAELLRCMVDHTSHICMYFVSTNAVKIIAKVGVVSPPSQKNVENFIFAELLKSMVDCTSYIYMYFVRTNAVETITRVGVVTPPSKTKKC